MIHKDQVLLEVQMQKERVINLKEDQEQAQVQMENMVEMAQHQTVVE
mgnify:CR=1 FL=1